MRSPLSIESIGGKTISGAIFFDGYYHDSVVIGFTDGSYARLTSNSGYDGEASLEIEEPEWDDILGENEDRYVSLGVITAEELLTEKQRRLDEEQRRKSWRELHERAEYEKLKRKFEGG